ncbi:dihydrofolate reductase family protein [Demequina oxidasica]|uniref:dihydrofolate reductase family protein n=1 Tax=Demequina oxidasica TaxID=676199 RepID=UPI000783FEE2|nr:dihydrofolate reductase family protein [Demequina oxidasica]
MADLYYTANMSLDGYTTDAHGNFDFSEPDDEVHQYFNDFERGFDTALYGRAMYETMVYWETNPADDEESLIGREFADVWRAQRKIVYSATLESVTSEHTALERVFYPEAVREMVRAEPRNVSIGGPTIAATALRAGIVDYVNLLVIPQILGGGLAALPGGLRASLELVEEQRFSGGTVRLLYRVPDI